MNDSASTVIARVYEDNAGGIHFVTNDGRSMILGTTRNQLFSDLVNLDQWLDDCRKEFPDDADQMDFGGLCVGHDSPARLVAEMDSKGDVTIYIDSMGHAARAYAGINLRGAH